MSTVKEKPKAKVKEVYVEASFTLNLGNYQNVKPTAGITLIPAAGMTTEEVFSQGWDAVGQQIDEQIAVFKTDKQGEIKKGLK